MSMYQPGIPTGTVDLDVDYQNLQNNFQQLDTTFGVDHTTFSNQTAQNGYHTNIHMIPASTTITNPPNNQPVISPTTTAGYGQLFSAQINDGVTTDEALYFKTGNGLLMQLTRNFQPIAISTAGFTYLPGGFIWQWGIVNTPGLTGTVNFPFAFPSGNAPFNIQLTLRRASGNQSLSVDSGTPPTNTSFVYLTSSNGSDAIYWSAIGI